MKFPDPLRTEDPDDFRTNRLVVSKAKGYFNIQYVDPDMSFQEMNRARTPVNPNTIFYI